MGVWRRGWVLWTKCEHADSALGGRCEVGAGNSIGRHGLQWMHRALVKSPGGGWARMGLNGTWRAATSAQALVKSLGLDGTRHATMNAPGSAEEPRWWMRPGWDTAADNKHTGLW